ncbi:hypothetical protein VTK26DRAFT_3452 [Humicola hyalothermophila]
MKLPTLLFTAFATILLHPVVAAPPTPSVEHTSHLLSSRQDAAAVDSQEDTTSSSSDSAGRKGKPPSMAVAADYGAPRCKSKALFDLCTASNADAYCDAQGFHCNFMASCKEVCWCE